MSDDIEEQETWEDDDLDLDFQEDDSPKETEEGESETMDDE